MAQPPLLREGRTVQITKHGSGEASPLLREGRTVQIPVGQIAEIQTGLWSQASTA